MQINKLLCIIHKLVKVVYDKTTYEDLTKKKKNLWNTIFVSQNLWINLIEINKENKIVVTNQNINKGGDNDGAVTAKKRISKKSTEEREQGSCSRPDVNILSCSCSGLTKWASQIIDQVWIDSIVSKPLSNFHTY